MAKTKRVKFVCNDSDCGAEDNPLFFENESVPVAINCWKCGAGRSIPNPHEMVHAGVGMFPVLKAA